MHGNAPNLLSLLTFSIFTFLTLSQKRHLRRTRNVQIEGKYSNLGKTEKKDLLNFVRKSLYLLLIERSQPGKLIKKYDAFSKIKKIKRIFPHKHLNGFLFNQRPKCYF